MTDFLKVKNRAISTLNGAINDSVTTLDVQSGDGSKFPTTGPFQVTLSNGEIVLVGARSTDTLSPLTRAQEGTSAASHADGAEVELKWTVKIIDDITAMFTSGKIVTYYGEVVNHNGSVVYQI